jgi:hypothetical protein
LNQILVLCLHASENMDAEGLLVITRGDPSSSVDAGPGKAEFSRRFLAK